MSKSKVNIKKNYEIKKIRKVMKMKDNNFEPATYEIFKVTGPNKFKKYFVSRTDAKSYIDKITDTKMTLSIVKDIMREVKMK
jgi:hypothetical protein